MKFDRSLREMYQGKAGDSDPETIRVLTVDDEPEQLELLTMYLEQYDPAIRVEPVTTPEETLRKLNENAYDCIVADHRMPGMTGIELAQKIKEDTHIPFILYTGRGSEEIASDAFAAGVDDYVRKEPDPEHYRDLAKRIRRAVEKYHTTGGKAKRRVTLPEYPKIEIRGDDVVIVYEDGREEPWGTEDKERIARGAGQGIELGLKAISYVKLKLADSIDDIMKDLMEVGIPAEYLDRIISEGYMGIRKLLIKLYYEKASRESKG